ncbi:MAG: type II and III secretion system protein, partial [Phycisphaerales bacterium]
AEVLVGTRIGYLSTTATQTTTTQTVEFLDTGIQLVFRPFISRDGMIRMELSPSVSEASLRTVTDANGLLVTIPDELTNELTTNVRIMDGQTLVLGGLYRESTRTTRRQIPFFGDIPLIGAAFRGQDDAIDRDEIIFLITPTIVKDDLLWEIGEEALAYGDAIRIGARAGLLPFSREKVTANHNQRAMDAQSRGDIDLALWHIKASLHLNSNQPEAVRFRQDLVGSKEMPHMRSMMERAFRSRMAPSLQSQANAATFPLPMTMPQNPFAAGAASDSPDDGWLQSVAEADSALEVSAQPAEAGTDANRQVEFSEPVAGAEQPPRPDDFESAVLWDDDFGSPVLPETQEFSPEPIQEDPNSWFAPSPSKSDDPSDGAEPSEDMESAAHFVPPPPFKDEASVFIGDSGYDDVIDGFVPPPSVKQEPSKFVRSSGYEQADQRVVAPPVKDEASRFIRGADNATADPWNPQFSQFSGQGDEFQPIPNTPVSINTPTAETRVEPSSHSISEQFVPGFGHHHVFWWMGWDPAAADAHAWEDPFPFVTFDYLPHVVSVPETPEP